MIPYCFIQNFLKPNYDHRKSLKSVRYIDFFVNIVKHGYYVIVLNYLCKNKIINLWLYW